MSGSIGVVGGGQLALMLAEAAQRLGVELHIQTPLATDPAAALATSVVQAPVDDLAGTRSLAALCQAISFENEWLNLDALAALEAEGVVFVPRLQALQPLVSKRSQRELLDRLQLASPRWIPLEAVLASPAGLAADLRPQPAGGPGGEGWQLATAEGGTADAPNPHEPGVRRLPEGFSFPLMAKAATGGYDGRGTACIHNDQELALLVERVPPEQWLLEEFVAFEQELALVACRDRGGNVRAFPLVQTHQHNRVCDWVLAPANVSHAVEARARNMAASLLTALDYAGVLSVEFFYGPAGLQVNELAPRTHNSGHYTIEATVTSQFEQQVRIVQGLGLGDTALKLPGALMVNLLGFETAASSYEEQRRALADLPGASVHWYGKRESSPGRKLGHVTLQLGQEQPEPRQQEAMQRLDQVRAIWPLPPEERP
jgi:5-(carboxyamino)imidazole ribonucleotide synthase